MQLVRRQLLAELGASVASGFARVGLRALQRQRRRVVRRSTATSRGRRVRESVANRAGTRAASRRVGVPRSHASDVRRRARVEWALLAFAFTLASLPLYRYDETVAALAPKNGAAGDPTPTIVGLLTFLRQFHVSHVRTYLRLMGQHLRVAASERQSAKVEAGFGEGRGSARRGWRRSASTRTCRGGNSRGTRRRTCSITRSREWGPREREGAVDSEGGELSDSG